jgi:hypothetical protein
MTRKRLDVRLGQHRDTSCCPHLNPWIAANADKVEIFAIASVDDEREARATEKVIIALCARLGHRLFNRTHVPTNLRWNALEAA